MASSISSLDSLVNQPDSPGTCLLLRQRLHIHSVNRIFMQHNSFM